MFSYQVCSYSLDQRILSVEITDYVPCGCYPKERTFRTEFSVRDVPSKLRILLISQRLGTAESLLIQSKSMSVSVGTFRLPECLEIIDGQTVDSK